MVLVGPDKFLDLFFSCLFCGGIGLLHFAGQLVMLARKLAQVIIGQITPL
jgi:hypothetical protein